jgi:hypothetical protein
MTPPDIKEQEAIFRFLARENRTRRRFLAISFNEFISKTSSDTRATRLVLPSNPEDPYYLFLLLPQPRGMPNSEYRQARLELLKTYLVATRSEYRDAYDIIGLATGTGSPGGETEDFVYLDSRDWTDEHQRDAEDKRKRLVKAGFLMKRTVSTRTCPEYPDRKLDPTIRMKGSLRNKVCPCGSGKKFKKCCGAS